MDLPRGGGDQGQPDLAHGKLFFGDYGGRVQAVRASNGRRVWSSAGAGRFYATAAVAGRRVFIGSTAGRVYAFSTRNGKLRWSHQTGRYVYASAAISRVKGWGRTVFVGSYDGRFYALSARSGRVRWTYNSGGKISGSATVIGRVVYFADLGHRRTIGLGTKTGRVSFRRSQGAYDPVISDGKHLYLTGNHTLTALRPLKPHGKAAKQRASARGRPAARHRRPTGGPSGSGRAARGPQARGPAPGALRPPLASDAMATTEEARPGLVLPEYGPTGPELVRRRLGRRGRRIAVAAAALVIVAPRGADRDPRRRRPDAARAPLRAAVHAPLSGRRRPPGEGGAGRDRPAPLRPRPAADGRGDPAPHAPALRGQRQRAAPRVRRPPGRRARARAAGLPLPHRRQGARQRRAGLPAALPRRPPAAVGTDVLVVPEDGDREGVLLRFRQTNPPRPLDETEKELVKATRKAFRSFRFGLDRP